MSGEVDRIFRQLVDVLQEETPERLTQPLQASELYQTIVPYRRFRDQLGFDSNQDYEMALLRLLAGEGGYARVEPVNAQEDLAAEAGSVNPNPAIVRNYAGVKVYLNANKVRDTVGGASDYAPPGRSEPEEAQAEPEQETEPEAAESAFDIADDVTDESRESVPGFVPTIESEAEEGGATPSPDNHCVQCGRSLPGDRSVRYCPFCGYDQAVIRCEECGTELERSWMYCITCGKQRV